MTKEELETREKLKLQNIAKDWLKTEHKEGNIQSLVNLISSFTEPREKQIEIDAKQIRALQKQNGELTDELTLTNNECKDMREELKQRIRENQKLCEQIEKMKCCANCKHFSKEDDLEYCWNCERQLVNSLDNLSREEIIKDEWEIKEK